MSPKRSKAGRRQIDPVDLVGQSEGISAISQSGDQMDHASSLQNIVPPPIQSEVVIEQPIMREVNRASSSCSNEGSCKRSGVHMKGKDISIPKYAGAQESRTPYDFLLELEKYKMAVDYTYEEMLKFVVPLALTETAYSWFEFIREDLFGWSDFVDAFRQEFQPIGYERELRRLLEDRFQGCHETLTEFIRIIDDFYRRLGGQVSESEKVDRIIRQMHPQYRMQILSRGRSYTSVKELWKEARNVQEIILMDRQYREPERYNFIEPSLAYKVPTESQYTNGFVHNMSYGSNSRELQMSSIDPYLHYHSKRPSFVSNPQWRSNNNQRSATNSTAHTYQPRSNFSNHRDEQRPSVQAYAGTSERPSVQTYPGTGDRLSAQTYPGTRESSTQNYSGPGERSLSNFAGSGLNTQTFRRDVERKQPVAATLNCYNCGEGGHFSRFCPNVPGNGLAPSRL
jgi:hypothetical protein